MLQLYTEYGPLVVALASASSSFGAKKQSLHPRVGQPRQESSKLQCRGRRTKNRMGFLDAVGFRWCTRSLGILGSHIRNCKSSSLPGAVLPGKRSVR